MCFLQKLIHIRRFSKSNFMRRQLKHFTHGQVYLHTTIKSKSREKIIASINHRLLLHKLHVRTAQLNLSLQIFINPLLSHSTRPFIGRLVYFKLKVRTLAKSINNQIQLNRYFIRTGLALLWSPLLGSKSWILSLKLEEAID